MEVNPNKGPQRTAKQERTAKSAQPTNQPATRAARPKDRIELSESARMIAGQESVGTESQAERLERLARLRDLVSEGRLNTTDRAEQSASRLLEGQ